MHHIPNPTTPRPSPCDIPPNSVARRAVLVSFSNDAATIEKALAMHSAALDEKDKVSLLCLWLAMVDGIHEHELDN